MWQDVIVWLVVAAAVVFAVRGVVKRLRGKQGCGCGCDGCKQSGGDTCNCKGCNVKLPDVDIDKVD